MGTELELRRGARLLATLAATLLTTATLAGACVLDRAGSLTGAAGGGGTNNPCDFCPGTDTACSYRTCDNGECGMADSFSGTLCNEDGGKVCDGSGHCVACSEVGHCGPQQVCDNNVCVPGECVDGTQNGVETDVDCGGGECAPCANGLTCIDPDDCATVFCNQGSCQNCSDPADCGAVGGYCNQGTCRPLNQLGEGCGSPLACESGNCPPQDGVCCNSPCDGTCESCQGSKTGGEDGTCALVTAGQDYDNECSDQGAPSCDANGTGCRGDVAACNLYPQGAICQNEGCSGGQETEAGTCDGNGLCEANAPTPCLPFICDAAACFTSCTAGSSECAPGYACRNGDCLFELGTACTGNNQCASNRCVEDVCCDVACDGTCESCLGAYNGGRDGTCANILAGIDPDDECDSPPSNNCDGDGTC